MVGVERLVELATRNEKRDDVGIGAGAIGRGVDRRFEVGQRLIAVAELVPELGALDAELGFAVGGEGADLRQVVPVGERRAARRLGGAGVTGRFVRVAEVAMQLARAR